jgi:hypothetical protein
MKKNIRQSMHFICLLSVALLINACSESQPEGEEITISGQIITSEDVQGKTFNLSVFHAQSGIGFQQHPLYEIESFTSQSLNFNHTFIYNSSGNTGLVVYAWLDTDQDGIMCTPQSRDDIAGIDLNEDFPNSNQSFKIELTQQCVGPDWFYPAAN